MSPGLRATFDKEFNAITADLILMSQKVEWAIERSIYALTESDRSIARDVIAGDQQVNDLRFKIEEACVALIATQQPAAKDLRSVIAVMHVVLDLERMADHAAGIAKTVLMMDAKRSMKALKKIPKMAELSRKMLADSIEAFNHRDVSWARAIAEQDAEMDHMYRSVFERLVEIMARRPANIANATYLMWCAHNLERIADRVTNIAEQVIFMTTGDVGELNV
jgi:phosphate transport system protein